MIRSYSTFVFVLTLPVILYSQIPYKKFEQISIEEGLPSTTVTCIVQDRQGFIWFGTTSGLCRYDGFNVKVYRKKRGIDSSLRENSVTSLFVDKKGTLWIGTLGYLQRYNEESDNFTHFPLALDSLFRGYINDIEEDSFGTLWISINRDRLVRFDRKKNEFRAVYFATENDTIKKNFRIPQILITKKDMLWVATSIGLYKQQLPLSMKNTGTSGRIDTVKFICYNSKLPRGRRNYRIRGFFEDKNRILWLISTYGHIVKYHNDKDIFITYPLNKYNKHRIRSKSILFLSENESDHLVVGTKYGCGIFDKKAGEYIDRFFDDTRINTYFMDRSGTEWYGTLYKGVLKISNEHKKFPPPLEFKNNAIFVDKQGIIWIGGLLGLYEINRKSGEYNLYPIRKTNWYISFFTNILAISEETSKSLWISTAHGLYKFDKEKKSFSSLPIKIGSNNWTSFYKDKSGIVWLGKEADGDGLYKFDPFLNAVSRFPFERHAGNNILKDRVTGIYEDSEESLWICTNRGLSKFDRLENNFTHYSLSGKSENKHSPEEYIRDVFEPNVDSKDILCVAADSGLYQFDRRTGKFSICRLSNGRPMDRDITGGLLKISGDKKGNIWFSSNFGLGKYNPETRVLKKYYQSDGLQGNTFNNAHYKSGDGEMFFGGLNGISAFYPDSIRDDPHIPEIVITDIKIVNKKAGFDSNPSLIKKIILSHKENIFTIEYAALNFTNPEKNQYAHKLENFDPDWIYTGNKHDVTYTNLDPGEYILRVKGSNSDGVWNEAGTSLKVIIIPPWWRTDLAYVFYISIFALIILAVWRVQVNRLQMRHRMEMEHLKSEKLKELDHFKSRFFANISHEFRTPLTLILGPAEQLLSGDFKGNLREEFKMIIRNGKRLLHLIEQLLDLSKLETGKMKLQARETNIVALTNELVQSFESLAVRKKINLNYQSEIEFQQVYLDIEKFETIMNNLLSNAFKATRENGEIYVNLKTVITGPAGVQENKLVQDQAQDTWRHYIHLSVSNTGPEIPADQLNHIFDRFYRIENSYTNDKKGLGIGLALTRELVELHHGTINVQCKIMEIQNSGTAGQRDNLYLTTFTLLLPIGKNHLKDNEIAKDLAVTDSKNIFDPELIDEHPESGTKHYRNEGLSPVLGKVSHFRSADSPLLLIVEDNSDLRQYIRRNLDGQYRIIEAEDGEQGLAKAMEKIPDLIISDVMMPKMDGFEFCRKIRTGECTSHIPLILITARAEREDKIAGLEKGADDYISKPFDNSELNIRIKNLLVQRNLLKKRFSGDIDMKAQDIAPTSRDIKFTDQLLEIIYQNMSDPKFNLEKLSGEVCMSRMSLYRKVRGLFGQSPGEFVRTIRLKRAAELLKNNSGNISEIAYDVGFSNPANFSVSFQRQFGISPTKYFKTINSN